MLTRVGARGVVAMAPSVFQRANKERVKAFSKQLRHVNKGQIERERRKPKPPPKPVVKEKSSRDRVRAPPLERAQRPPP